MTRWILASASPRRRQLLQQMGIRDFAIFPAQGEECSVASDPGSYVEELARHKALEVYRRAAASPPSNEACFGDVALRVIGADTIVVCNGHILGKPTDREDAARMIRSIQGRGHEVMTGVSLIWDGIAGSDDGDRINAETFHVTTTVHVAPMDEEEIARYLATGEADDKAGAYGIQGAFGTFIEGIEGDYYNVVGLPIAALYQTIKRRHLL